MRVEAHRLLYHPEAFLRWPRIEQNHPQVYIAIRIIGIESESPLYLGESLIMLLFAQIDFS